MAEQELIARYRAGYEQTVSAIEGLDEAEFVFKPAPDKWSAKEVMLHLCDAELVATYRIKSTIAEPNPILFPFEPDMWAGNLSYLGQDHRAALEIFRVLRANTSDLLATLPAEAWERTLVHRASGKMTLRQLVETFTKHVDRHIGQIERARQAYAAAAQSK